MAEKFNEMQIVVFRAAPPEAIYRRFVSMFPEGYAQQLDFLLLRGLKPESVFELPSAADIPTVIKEVTIKALYWRKEQLIAGAGNN